MFYVLSKLLLFLIQPSMWIIFFLVGALWNKSAKRKKRLLISALVVFFVFGNTRLYNAVMKGMETPKHEINDASSSAPYAIVLGGFGDYNERNRSLELNAAADRLTESLVLYTQGKIEHIIISSGVHGEDESKTEALIAKDFLIQSGIPADQIFCENLSWNTHMNALYSAALVDSLHLGRKGLLITSAFHMTRAMACFEKQGFDLKPYPVDFYSEHGSLGISSLIWPSMRRVNDWDIPIKEWVGRLVYRLKGYT